jgi:hypothetical protein
MIDPVEPGGLMNPGMRHSAKPRLVFRPCRQWNLSVFAMVWSVSGGGDRLTRGRIGILSNEYLSRL